MSSESSGDNIKAVERLGDERYWPLLDAVTRRWVEQRRPLVQEYDLPTLELHVQTNIDADAWKIGYLSVREREPPPDLIPAMREVAPQALLRDLHRPQEQFIITGELKEGMFRPPLTDAFRLIRASQQREPLPTIEPLMAVVTQLQTWRRNLLLERWQPHKPDDERRDDDASRANAHH